MRKSETAWIKASDDPVVDKLIRKCVSMTDRPLDHCEDLQVLSESDRDLFKGIYVEHNNKILDLFEDKPCFMFVIFIKF